MTEEDKGSIVGTPRPYNGRVVVDAVAAGNTNALLADLNKLGLQHASTYGSFVSGLLPIEAIDEMTRLASLKFARPAYRPATNVSF